ncbi:MAG TPA: aspartate 1-decarboxylase [archaeon]|nr:aspartate 1-decarboxylase [archaeon]
MREFLRSKIHRATVTDANLDYIGSISIDKLLMEKSGLGENEKVHVWNISNGERIETYVISGKKGEITLNGAGAHKFKKGDKIIIAAFEISEKAPKPKLVLVNDSNEFVKYL